MKLKKVPTKKIEKDTKKFLKKTGDEAPQYLAAVAEKNRRSSIAKGLPDSTRVSDDIERSDKKRLGAALQRSRKK
jgi:hypothetical protein